MFNGLKLTVKKLGLSYGRYKPDICFVKKCPYY